MAIVQLDIDDRTAAQLEALGQIEGESPHMLASKLLTRAVKLARRRPAVDREALRKAYAECEEDELALAESGIEERAKLLQEEDEA